MLHKSYGAQFKAQKDDDGKLTGEVSAIVSVYGNVDLMGDVVVEGAFDGDIKSWQDSGDPLPMVWSHDWSNPMSHIGTWDMSKARNVKSDEMWKGSPAGLLLEGQVDMSGENPIAIQVAKLMADRRVKEFSFAYDIEDEGPSEEFKGANELRALRIHEAGPTLKGANPATELVMAKAIAEHAAKAGRVLSAKNEGLLRDAATAIETVLASLGADEPKARKHDDGTSHDGACDACGAPTTDGKFVAEEPKAEEADDIEAAHAEAIEEESKRTLAAIAQADALEL
jgi:HK97 family phage prohead protease